jgi:methylisocitrate lyase
VPDIGLLSANDFADRIAVLASATPLPLLADADTGFGEALNVSRTVRLYEQAGAAGLHLEDQRLPKRCGHLTGKALVPPHEMVSKIRAAVDSRRDDGFVVVARTDARSVEGLDAALVRARLYIEAGADMIFPEALECPEEFARFAAEVPAPLIANMTEFGRGPLLDFSELAGLGYRAALYPLTAFRSAMKASEETLRTLMEHGSQRTRIDSMQTRAELYDLIGYESWESKDASYFGRPPG